MTDEEPKQSVESNAEENGSSRKPDWAALAEERLKKTKEELAGEPDRPAEGPFKIS